MSGLSKHAQARYRRYLAEEERAGTERPSPAWRALERTLRDGYEDEDEGTRR